MTAPAVLALPYITVSTGPVRVYGLLVTAGLVVGVMVAALAGRKRGLPAGSLRVRWWHTSSTSFGTSSTA